MKFSELYKRLNKRKRNKNFSILLNPDTILDIENLKETDLFNLEIKYKKDIVAGLVNKALRDEFENKNSPLSKQAKITKESDKCWHIKDGYVTYKIDDAGPLLHVCEKKIEDQFGFEEKIDNFINYLDKYLGNRKSIVVGISGDYGSGKSVFINLIKDKVETKKSEPSDEVYSQKIKRIFCNIFCKYVRKTGKPNGNTLSKFIIFHAWKYKDEESIWRNFVLKIGHEFEIKKLYRNKKVFNKQKENLIKKSYYSKENSQPDNKEILPSLIIFACILASIAILLNTNDVFRDSTNTSNVLTLIFSIISTVFLIFKYHSTKYTKQPMSSIEEFEKEFRSLIDNCKYDELYITIENIDRCLPHQSIRLLESLKAFLENNDDDQLKNDIIFLIPCDKNILQLSIEKEYGNSNKLNSSTYLDKLIQLPYDLPVCSDKDWKGYVESLINRQHINISLSFENGKTNKTENKTFSEWIIEMLGFAQITNPREVKILFREWEMRFINLPVELKTDKVQCLKSALFLLKLLILKKRGYHDGSLGDINDSIKSCLSKNVYKNIESFCLYINPRIEIIYENSKQTYAVFESKIPNIESVMSHVDSINNFEHLFNKNKFEKQYHDALHDYMGRFLNDKRKAFNIENNEFFKDILNSKRPVPMGHKGYNFDFIDCNHNFIDNHSTEDIKQILDFLTQNIFVSEGALVYLADDLLRQNYDVSSCPKDTDQIMIQRLLLNPIRPSSFEDLKKFMITTKSSKGYGSEIIESEIKRETTKESTDPDKKKAMK